MSDLLYYLKSEMLEADLKAAKLREAELNDTNVAILIERDNWMHKFDARQAELLSLTQERDAALSALSTARSLERNQDYLYHEMKQGRDQVQARLNTALEALEKLLGYNECILAEKINYRPEDHIAIAKQAIATIANPSAALAERDRETGKRTAERCVAIAAGCYSAEAATGYIRREFKLEPKLEA